VLAFALLMTLAVLAACGGDDDSSDVVQASDSGTDTSAQEEMPGNGAHLPILVPKKCGDPVVFKKKDPDGILAELEKEHPELKDWYGAYFGEVRESPWRTWKGKKPPWQIGYVSFPTANVWKEGLLDELKAQFAKAKEAGLVSGNLRTYIQPSFDTATPEQQTQAIQQMVRDGVDLIFVHPLNSRAQAASFDEAGKKGVPIVLTSDVAPDSKYVVNLTTFNQGPGYTDFLKMQSDKGWFNGETRKWLEVRGLEGNTFEQTAHDAAEAAVKPCKGAEKVGEVFGNFDPAHAKAEIQKFLASNPGKIDFVEQQGSQGAGVIQAFEAAGREVPPMAISGTSGGDLAWWDAHKDTYDSVGYHYSGPQTGYAVFQVGLRMLNGQGLKVRDIHPPGIKVTNDNIGDVATPGKPITWIGDIRGPVTDYITPEQIDWFFEKAGDPEAGN
jgi:ribose transport system substrate-binding protein